MLKLEFYDEEKDIIREALEMYLHAIKGEPYEIKKPESENERHFDEDAVRDVLLRFE
jgi:hypothetical protein